MSVAALVAVLVIAAKPAAADPARPTDYRSEVLSVDPELPRGVTLDVVGGDAFLRLRVSGGHTVEVPDYASGSDTEPRPYLRFGPDGTVERNERSAAASANESRYGVSDGRLDVGVEPRWRVVSRDGTYVWHDHRIHWMLPRAPTAVGPNGRVDLGGPDGTWTIDLVVDGDPVVVRGELLLSQPPSPLPWISLGLIVVAVIVGLAARAVRSGRQPSHRVLAGVLAAGGAGATFVGWAQWRSIPAGAGGNPLTAAVPALAAVAAVVALVVSVPKVRLAALALGAATLGGWAVLRRDVLVRAVLPTTVPFDLDRAVTASALAIAAAAAIVIVWRPPIAPPAPPATPTPPT